MTNTDTNKATDYRKYGFSHSSMIDELVAALSEEEHIEMIDWKEQENKKNKEN